MAPPLHSLLAALPILTILLLMVGFGWPAARAGAAGFGVTLAVALGPFQYGTVIYGDIGRAGAVAWALAEAVFTTATIIWIVWPAVMVGLLGTFVTGSATSSNILFTDLQVSAAGQAGMPVVQALGAQGFGAAAGNMIAPHNLIAGAAVGAVGREGEILRRTLAPALAYAALGGLLAWVWFA